MAESQKVHLEPGLYSMDKSGFILDLSANTLYRWINDGLIEATVVQGVQKLTHLTLEAIINGEIEAVKKLDHLLAVKRTHRETGKLSAEMRKHPTKYKKRVKGVKKRRLTPRTSVAAE
jgi:hypothetical protein